MAVTISGTTGVGVSTTPSYPVDVYVGTLGTTANSQLVGARLLGTSGTNGDILEVSHVRGSAGTDWQTAGWRLQQRVDNTWMGYIQFNGTASGTNNNGISIGTGSSTVSANSVTERLRIDATGNVTVSTGNVTVSGNMQATSYNGGQLAGLRNVIINGNMGIYQRGTTAVVAAGIYGPADRWKSDAAGDSFSTTQGVFVSGETLYDTGGAQYYTQVSLSHTLLASNYFKIGQGIENVRILAGETVTVSFWAKANANTTIALEMWQNFGTGGSASVTGIGQAQAITTTWAKYSKTFVIPSVNGKTIGPSNTSFTQLEFWLDAGTDFSGVGGRAAGIGSQSTKTVSFAQVQVEIGSVATPFEQRPIGMELALCQRYYEKSFPQATTPASALGSGASGAHRFIAGKAGVALQFTNVKFSVTKRASAGVTVIYNPNAAGNQARDNVAAVDCTATTTTTVENNLFVNCTGAATTAVGNYIDFAWTVESEL